MQDGLIYYIEFVNVGILQFLLYKMTFFPSSQFLFFQFDTSPRYFKIQNKMIETLGAKIRENFGKSKHPT